MYALRTRSVLSWAALVMVVLTPQQLQPIMQLQQQETKTTLSSLLELAPVLAIQISITGVMAHFSQWTTLTNWIQSWTISLTKLFAVKTIWFRCETQIGK